MTRSLRLVFALLALSACNSRHVEGDIESLVPALIEFRLVHAEPGVDREPQEFQGQTLYLESAAVVSDPDFQIVRARLRPERFLIEIELTPEAAARLDRVTAENIGKRMALLLDSRVVQAPHIRSAVGSPLQAAVPLPTVLSEDEASEIAERLRVRWPDVETGRADRKKDEWRTPAGATAST